MKILADRLPFHYGWLIVLVAILSNAVAGGAMFWSVTVYVPRISEDFGIGRTSVVTAFMIGQTIFALVGPITGRYIDRNGARRVLQAGAILAPLALIVTSMSTQPWHLYAGWGVVSVVRTLVMPIPLNWTLTRWFEGRRRQAALGLVTTGFGLGGAVMLPIYVAIAAWGGWQATMLASGLMLLAVQGIAAFAVVRDHPSHLGLRAVVAADERRADADAEIVEWGFTASQAVRTVSFWLLGIGLMLFFLGQGSVTTLAIDFFDSRAVAAGATALAASAFLRATARVPLGLSLSRITRVYTLAIVVALSQGVALVVLLVDAGGVGLLAWVVLWGIGGAFAPMLEPLLITKTFGVRHFGAVSGMVQMVAFGGQLFGTIGGAALFDVFGSYSLPFALYAAGFLAAAALLGLVAVSAGREAHRTKAESAGFGS